MNTDFERFIAWIGNCEGYQAAFAKAYPGEPVGPDNLKHAIASFEQIADVVGFLRSIRQQSAGARQD